MINLRILIEIQGEFLEAGHIQGDSNENATFTYAKGYINSKNTFPLSFSLPFQEEPFSPTLTKNYFDGLLPEGFTRKTVAENLHLVENDYLGLLLNLGRECIGAIKVEDCNAQNTAENRTQYIKVTPEDIKKLASKDIAVSAMMQEDSRLSLAGASGKVGLYLCNGEWYQAKGLAASTHIIKQSHVRLDSLIVNEQLCMITAKKLGINVAESFIINTGGTNDSEILFASKRFDRIFNEDCKKASDMISPLRLHQEDFAQALSVSSMGKYEKNNDQNYLKRMFRLLINVSSDPIEDSGRLWKLIIFNYFIGNTDCHLKNFSLLYNYYDKSVRLSPAYDVLSTVIYNETSKKMPFAINGKYFLEDINEKDFLECGKENGLSLKLTGQIYNYTKNNIKTALLKSADDLKKQGSKNAKLIAQRIIDTSPISKN